MGEYELEQDDSSNDKLNSEERVEIIPNGGSSSKKRDVRASFSLCVIIDNVQGTIKRWVKHKFREM